MWKAMNVFIDQIRRLYNDWDIRAMVLLSLLLQVLLQLLGNRRKFSRSVWLRIIVWFSYVTVDSIAILALGMISTKLGRIDDLSHLDGETKLNALWAPCLLLLLGGPDSITAYSVEDNQLWLRHFLVFVAQTTVVGYVCFLAWASDCLSYLSLLLLVAGVIKYGERVWVLWQVSFDKLRNTGFLSANDSEWKSVNEFDGNELIGGYKMFRIFKRVFLHQKLDSQARYNAKGMFDTHQKAFKIIEIELGFMYDLLYTKAKTTYTRWGLSRRLMTLTISCVVLAVFSCWFAKKKTSSSDYPRADVAVTLVLLATNIWSEIYWVCMLLSSDWVEVMWIRRDQPRCSKKLWIDNTKVVRNTLLQLCKQPRWTNSVGQLSFSGLFMNNFDDERLPGFDCGRLLKCLHLHEKVGPYYYAQHQQITDHIKEQILLAVQQIRGETELFASDTRLYRNNVEKLLRRLCIESLGLNAGGDDLLSMIHRSKEFEDNIIIWHIATELFYTSSLQDQALDDTMKLERNTAMMLSRYMFYLLVRHPSMLQAVDANIKLKDIRDEYLKVVKEKKIDDLTKSSYVKKLLNAVSRIRTSRENLPERLSLDACGLANSCIRLGARNMHEVWTVISKAWLTHLIHSAYNCNREEYHTHQLRRGGELLTHVWMLMVHLGITDYHWTSPYRSYT